MKEMSHFKMNIKINTHIFYLLNLHLFLILTLMRHWMTNRFYEIASSCFFTIYIYNKHGSNVICTFRISK